MQKLWILSTCAVIALLCLSGCGKGENAPVTKQEVAAFKGHQPTADQLKEAMSKATKPAPPNRPGQAPK